MRENGREHGKADPDEGTATYCCPPIAVADKSSFLEHLSLLGFISLQSCFYCMSTEWFSFHHRVSDAFQWMLQLKHSLTLSHKMAGVSAQTMLLQRKLPRQMQRLNLSSMPTSPGRSVNLTHPFGDFGRLILQGKLFPPETRRCNRLLWRSPTCREKFFMHPLYQVFFSTHLPSPY